MNQSLQKQQSDYPHQLNHHTSVLPTREVIPSRQNLISDVQQPKQQQQMQQEFQRPIVSLKQKMQEKEEQKQQRAQKKINNSLSVDRCDECKKAELVTNHVEGTIVCQNCGLVQQQRIIDDSSEWRTFSSETSSGGANPSRVGGRLNPYLSNYGIDTRVTGNNASEIQKWSDRSSLNAKDKLISKGLRAIKDYAQMLNMKEGTINMACDIYKEIEDKEILRGKSVNGKVAGAIYYASRKNNQPRSLKKILATMQVNFKELNSCTKKIRELFPDERVIVKPWQLADQACNKLELGIDVNNAAKHTAEQIYKLEIATGRQPQTIAGVAVFIVSQLSTQKKSLSEIAESLSITEQTIKTAYKEIYEYRTVVIPPYWKHKESVDSLQKP
ncbi:transcription initiation factor iib [Stylonychia lemnae]|uniref:General transcription factor TFIIB n=1 Tax=Stylonychia lemnae TaxID=5949 RepID=A0A077ZUY0_STYLE|nr:transcription initiation factor iib [Stylonychia lemnae]|eukprot:CDW73110.1 transcription initiation factor iib [Stylonychia lemnae]